MTSCSLGLTHLIGTPTLKPYMHGFFLSLKLYDAARLIANPFAYAEHRERVVREKMEKLSESRIRSRGGAGAGAEVKVNKALAERIRREEKRAERKKEKEGLRDAEEGEAEEAKTKTKKSKAPEGEVGSLLSDPRFAEVFDNPDFEVDTMSREFGLLNPSSSAAMNAVSPLLEHLLCRVGTNTFNRNLARNHEQPWKKRKKKATERRLTV